MAVKGLRRYFRLLRHVANPAEYLLHKGDRHSRPLSFTTKPLPIHFRVPASLYLLFKEIFMVDVYEMDSLVSQLPAEPVVIDIGANVGFFDVQLLSKINKATIYAYEPIPANVKTFQDILQQNPRLLPSVQIFEMAVTGQPTDKLSLFAEGADNNQVVASVFAGFNENNTQRLSVDSITLTEIIRDNKLSAIDLLKLDCEGSEFDIIYHTDPELLKRIKRMYVEVHNLDDNRNNIDAFNKYVQSLGYTTTYVPINSFCYALEAVQQTN
ncbi:FkbM family methyltransferase [Spirosoma sp. KNUC1025]|uniref:FkbM family methyltransferase n=1 Tax=Spirosoma sp. KNUC1025 TaxID=2894082 RepID=UPI00386BF397|nr:FkbM family methyltransferase [Spirosoma sp. KNUC1025]